MTRILSLTTVLLLTGIGFAADPPKVSDLTLDDQFETKNSVTDYKGKVLILVFGDRKGLDASRDLGSKLHVLFHPSAEGKTAKEARTAAVDPLPGIEKGKTSPDVAVVPVACCGKVPGLIQGTIRGALKKDAADTPVWLDFGSTMKDKFGLTEGESNLVVIDAQGRLRLKVNGNPDKETLQMVLQTTQNLRAEAAGLR